MKVHKITSILLFLIVLNAGCYYDVEEELYPSIECQTLNMSYSDDILPIIVENCNTCHSQASNFGNITTEGYDQLIKYVNDGSLLGVINHEAGFSAMPKNQAKLLDCEIEKIEAWIANGAFNN